MAATGTLAAPAAHAIRADDDRPAPNVIVVFCDDMGWGDVGCFGHPTIKTPNLDRMAAEGQKWTQFYAAAPLCTPSRAGLLTGRYPIRSGMTSATRAVLLPDSGGGLPPEETTLAEFLKQKGYATGCFGKWHLGHLPRFLPTARGFDTFFGILYSNDMDFDGRGADYLKEARRDPDFFTDFAHYNVPLMQDQAIIERPVDQRTLTRRCTEKALQFVRANQDRPFFVYLPHAMPHAPLFCSGDFRGKSRRGLYGDVVEELDWSVGQIMTTLKELKIDGKTMLMFSSDNGPWLHFHTHGGSAGPLRGGKGTTFEGGQRAPTLFWWPGTIPAGSVVAGLGCATDMMATLASLTGFRLPADRKLDSVDLSPALLGAGKSPRTTLAYWTRAELCAYREGPWKLHVKERHPVEYWRTEKTTAPELYHVETDIAEAYNVADRYPEIVERLIKAMRAHKDDIDPVPDQLAMANTAKRSADARAEAIDLRRLLEQMLNRARIAEFPEPEFVCRQASSYNRRSKTPGTADWFAGHDFDQFYGSIEREGRREWIMLDAEGPGVVVRWWLTQFRNAGTIRIYLDGTPEPLFEGDGNTLVGGKMLAEPPLAGIVGGGRNLYLPIPFRNHCRITFESPRPDADFAKAVPPFTNESIFYNINYVQYPAGTDVQSLTMADLEAHHELIANVGRELQHPARNALPVRRTVEGGRQVLKPGESLIRKCSGSGAIAVLRIKLDAKDLPQALRSTVLTAAFDGRRTVAAPVGEFFGSGLGLNPYQSWWSKVENDGWMTCWWPMPFKESAEVRVTNHHAAESVDVQFGELGITDWTWTPRTMYFHTAWRGEDMIRFGSNSDPQHIKDWNYVTIAGKGVYAGDSLSLYNRPVMEGRLGPWWGEGDEKIYVDGESFPSHFGTGSEDYYGYAFNHTKPFEAPFHAQPSAGGNWGIGHTTDVRGRVLDGIPFKTAFRFDMELYHWQPNVSNDYAATTQWYAFPGTTDNGQLTPAKVREKIGQPLSGGGAGRLGKGGTEEGRR